MSLLDPRVPSLVAAFLGRRRTSPPAASTRRDPMFRSSGSSFDLKTLRDWQLADDPRRIDWRLAARSGRLCVKEYYEEESDGAAVLVDLSPSMGILNEGADLEAPRAIGMNLAWMLSALGLPCFLMVFAGKPRRVLNRPRPSPATGDLEAFFALRPSDGIDAAGSAGTDLRGAMGAARKACRWRRLVVVSDFFDPGFSAQASPFSRNAWIRLYRPLGEVAGEASELLVTEPEGQGQLRQAWDGRAKASYREREEALAATFREAQRRGAFCACLHPKADRRDFYWSFLEALHA